MKRSILFLLSFILSISTIMAQKNLHGVVVDASTNKPLEGASIVLGKHGTSSDKDGKFSIDCSKTGTLSISYLGYESKKLDIKNCDAVITISLASEKNYMNEVEITAISNPNKSILYQPSSIAKLSTLELKRGTGLFLDDAINANIPGMSMQRRTVSAGQQFNLRGYGNGSRGTRGISSNFDGQGYKVYLNGIPVTDAEGISVLDDIDFGSIANVEVTKGPAGTLYGLAIAGAVNLKTVKEIGRAHV